MRGTGEDQWQKRRYLLTKVKIQLEDIPPLNIHTVSVIGSFNNYDATRGILQKQGEQWTTYVELPPGEHYYKFLINQQIKINDPNANTYLPHKGEELWSLITINEKGEQLYNNEQYAVHIEDYAVSGTVTTAHIETNKKSYNLLMDKKIVTRFEFRQITGLHAVTVLWYDATGQLHEITENALYAEEDPKQPVYLWYWIDLDIPNREYPEGNWTMQLYIDGSYILEDRFSVTKSITYTKNTVLHHL